MITDYASLQSAITDWILRDDLSPERVQDFIRLAESKMDMTLRSRELKVEIAVNAGADGNTRVPIPADYNQLILMQPVGGWEVVDGVLTTNTLPGLQPLVPISFNMLRASSAQPGAHPLVFAEVPNGSDWELWPMGGQFIISIWYFQKVPKLSDENPTNELLTNWPDLYLAGAMIEAEIFLKTPQAERGGWVQMYGALIQQLNNTQRQVQVSGGTLRTMPAYGNR